ncbi:unnamed protein product, partial [Protopolystoma xenopodis]
MTTSSGHSTTASLPGPLTCLASPPGAFHVQTVLGQHALVGQPGLQLATGPPVNPQAAAVASITTATCSATSNCIVSPPTTILSNGQLVVVTECGTQSLRLPTSADDLEPKEER